MKTQFMVHVSKRYSLEMSGIGHIPPWKIAMVREQALANKKKGLFNQKDAPDWFVGLLNELPAPLHNSIMELFACHGPLLSCSAMWPWQGSFCGLELIQYSFISITVCTIEYNTKSSFTCSINKNDRKHVLLSCINMSYLFVHVHLCEIYWGCIPLKCIVINALFLLILAPGTIITLLQLYLHIYLFHTTFRHVSTICYNLVLRFALALQTHLL